MSEQFLDGADIVTCFEEVSRETVAEGVATGRLWYASSGNSLPDCVLQVLLVRVMAPSLQGARVDGEFGGRKNVLPAPVALGVGVFPLQAKGQIDFAAAAGLVGLVNLLHSLKVLAEGLFQARRQEGDSFPHALAFTHGDLLVAEIDVLYPKPEAFEQAQAAPVEQLSHKPVVAA